MAGVSGEGMPVVDRALRGCDGEAGEYEDMLLLSLPLKRSIGDVIGVLGGAIEHWRQAIDLCELQ